jgi:hypothetical protein
MSAQETQAERTGAVDGRLHHVVDLDPWETDIWPSIEDGRLPLELRGVAFELPDLAQRLAERVAADRRANVAGTGGSPRLVGIARKQVPYIPAPQEAERAMLPRERWLGFGNGGRHLVVGEARLVCVEPDGERVVTKLSSARMWDVWGTRAKTAPLSQSIFGRGHGESY